MVAGQLHTPAVEIERDSMYYQLNSSRTQHDILHVSHIYHMKDSAGDIHVRTCIIFPCIRLDYWDGTS